MILGSSDRIADLRNGLGQNEWSAQETKRIRYEDV
jgi:hypothetical protein